jgi:alkanesulfonate monooxygenase SsuD/methylene tetrahydromethanopterin reductase-like flavin-dependent oxidoreductase (luciferase family)
MKFMFMSEGETLPGESYQTRYWELVDEVIHAEKWGFDSFGVSEQQFAIGGVSTSCPEVLYGYLFALTKRLRFSHAITLIPKNINHALKIATRVAVEDVLSNGRIELGLGRGNTTLALRAYEVDLEKSRGEQIEGIKVIKAAFTQDPFMFYGEHYKIPPRSLVPKPVQDPHPPIYTAATSPESHEVAAELGIGVYSWSNFFGWESLEKSISAYRKRIAQAKAGGDHVNDQAGALVQGYCAATDEQAREDAAEGNLKWLKLALDGYPRLAKMSKNYAYMGQVSDVHDKLGNYAYFKEGSGAAIFGSPESCIKAIEKFQSLGYSQVLIRIDSVPHDKILKSIEMFGRYVIPHFKNPRNFIRPAEDVLADIRAMREEAKQRGVYVEMDTPAAQPQGKKEAVS